MQLEITPELAEVRSALRRFATEQLEPLALEIDRTGEIPQAAIDPAARAGLPRHAPARGVRRRRLRPRRPIASRWRSSRARTACSRCSSTRRAASRRSRSRGPARDAQKNKYVPGLANGTLNASFALTEPEAGSDSAAITHARRRARRRLGPQRPQALHQRRAPRRRRAGDRGHRPREARARRHHRVSRRPGHAGIQRDARRHDDRLGGDQAGRADASRTASCRMARCSARSARASASRWVADQRAPGVSCSCIGAADRLIEMSVAYAKERHTFGKPLAERQAIQWMLADSATELATRARSTYETLRQAKAGDELDTAASMCKLYAPRWSAASPTARCRSTAAWGWCAAFRSSASTATCATIASAKARPRSSAC